MKLLYVLLFIIVIPFIALLFVPIIALMIIGTLMHSLGQILGNIITETLELINEGIRK